MILKKPKVEGCFFCGRGHNIRVAQFDDNGIRHPVCHVCFNRLKLCVDGLVWNGKRYGLVKKHPGFSGGYNFVRIIPEWAGEWKDE